MRVKLVKRSGGPSWYDNKIGEEFTVTGYDSNYYAVIEDGKVTNKLLTRKDCIRVQEESEK